jgi:membrane protease YdiL (CAAX protease family)
MNLSKLFSFFLIKIIIAIVIVGGSVALSEWLGRSLLDQTHLKYDAKNLIIAFTDVFAALFTYVFLFRFYEKRKITELNLSTFSKNAIMGFGTGILLQSLFILIIFIAGNYIIMQVNPVSHLLPSFTAAITAGFVAEIMIVGIFFRLTEQTLGTLLALLITCFLFAIMHINIKGASAISISTTAIQAGILLPAAFIYSRNLWLPIFLHFAWDFSEPGIFGGINPGISIDKTLFTSKIAGTTFISGGQTGPQNSIQAFVLCSATAIFFLWMAKQKNNFINPSWRK